jgi:hypothetical protein
MYHCAYGNAPFDLILIAPAAFLVSFGPIFNVNFNGPVSTLILVSVACCGIIKSHRRRTAKATAGQSTP